MSSKVSFTVRPPPRPIDTDDTLNTSRPASGSASPDSDGLRIPHRPTTSSPLVPATNRNGASSSRPAGKRQWASYTGPDSSDEEEGDTAEIITGFDAMGVQRLDDSKNKPKGPLVIVSQKNRDWRAESAARKRQAMKGYVPDGAKVATGKDGSQGGLGTRGTINDGPQLSGLIVKPKEEGDDVKVEEEDVEMQDDVKEEVKEEEMEMDDDQRALRALLRGGDGEEKRREIAAIRVEDQQAWNHPKTEADAFKEDILTRPDEATLEDYERVPIELFGEAMLRGMGHTPGKAASRTGAGRVDPYIPESRPALLGIGAKPRPTDDDSAGKNGSKKFTRPDKRYVPIVKVERTNSGSGVSSRRTSRSRSGSPPRERKREKERDSDRDRARDRDRDGYRERDRDERQDRDRDDRKRERGYDSERRAEERPREKDRDRRRDYDSDRDYERRRDRDTRDRGDDRRDRRR